VWISGDLFAAADTPALGGGGSDQLIVMVGGVIVAAIGGLVTIVVAVINTRSNRTSPSPPPADPGGGEVRALRDTVKGLAEDVGFLRERVARVELRAQDSDSRDEMQDRRLEQIERAKDIDHPGWRLR
jgi:hypothetical protein